MSVGYHGVYASPRYGTASYGDFMEDVQSFFSSGSDVAESTKGTAIGSGGVPTDPVSAIAMAVEQGLSLAQVIVSKQNELTSLYKQLSRARTAFEKTRSSSKKQQLANKINGLQDAIRAQEMILQTAQTEAEAQNIIIPEQIDYRPYLMGGVGLFFGIVTLVGLAGGIYYVTR